MKKGFFAAFLCALVMVLLPAAAYAKDGDFGSADGSSTNPYIIEDAEDLKAFRYKVNSGETTACAELTADIVLNENVLKEDGSLNSGNFEEWTPIGTESNRYTGTFDGKGYTISGIYINTNKDYQGLFGYIVEGGTVKDLGIEDSWISGGYYVGGIVGDGYKGRIEGCYNTGKYHRLLLCGRHRRV